eukprot:jgi/Pico_ML_1/53482/g4019.t1
MATRASVQWFPGHMAKATRAIQQRLKAVDAVVEVRDARAPWASANATLDAMLRHKTRIVALHKAELADVNQVHKAMQKMRMEGVPNVGKSTLINAMRGLSEVERTSKAAVGPLPGVTRELSAFQIGTKPIVYLLDTPGIMMPKVEDEETGLRLASIGVIKDSIVGEEKIAEFLLETLSKHNSIVRLFREGRFGQVSLDVLR